MDQRTDRRRSRSAAVAAAVAVAGLAAAVQAAPVTGTFKSDDLQGGVFLTGRWTEGFAGGPQSAGNGLHAASWDAAGLTLGSHWTLDGLVLAGSTTSDFRDGQGTGTVRYDRTFDTAAAGMILKARPWWTGQGDGDYTVDILYYTQVTTELYEAGALKEVTSAQSFAGEVAGHPGHQVTGQANWALAGQGGGPLPANYPPWQPGTAVSGAWGDVGQVRLTIVPEPGGVVLLTAGLAVACLFRREKGRFGPGGTKG